MRVPEPMYATIAAEVPAGRDWWYEQKYDGMRVIAVATSRAVHLVTRNGHDKRLQFPEIASALRELVARAGRPLVLDGEIVALVRGRPALFQALQGRFHRKQPTEISALAKAHPAALVLFDILRDGKEPLTRLPLRERRERLEAVARLADGTTLRMSECSSSAKRMLARASRSGWEGVIAKQVDSRYDAGARSRAWLKLKLQHRAEFVVGGYTDPRKTRPYLGALLLGYFDARGKLRYAGHMGGGFNRASLRDMLARLEPLGRKSSPFADPVKTNEPAHWVTPKVVVEVKFAEWTSDGRLRQPIFLGVRDDKPAREVHKERESVQHWAQEIA